MTFNKVSFEWIFLIGGRGAMLLLKCFLFSLIKKCPHLDLLRNFIDVYPSKHTHTRTRIYTTIF